MTKRFCRSLIICLSLFLVLGIQTRTTFSAEEAKKAPPVAESTTREPAQEPLTTSPSASPATVASETPSDSSASSETTVEESASSVQMSAPGNVTVDFKDADIQNVLRILAFKSGVNIVAGKDVTGNVTIRLVDVPWEKALDVILKTYGYAYDRKDNVIRVATLDNLNHEELSTEVFTLNYSRASDVEKSVKDMLSERGRVRSDSRSNTLIVTDMPTSLQNIRNVIQRLDAMTPQVLIEAKVVELSLGQADRVGIDWQISAAVNGSKRPTTAPFNATQRSRLSNIFPYGRGSQSTAVAVGSSTSTLTIEDFPKGKGGSGADPIQPSFPVADKTDFTFGAIDFTQFRVLLEAILSRQDSKVLSEPHVTVLNNQEAKILVGEIIAIPTFERNSTTGKMEITGYQDRDLGIRLAVVPQVNSESEIVVTIHPEITSLIGYDSLTEEIKAPRFSTREAMTNVRIRSGQTIAIGGLIKEDVEDKTTKFPFLGDIPVLDKFFSYQNKVVTKTDLLFFMTVTVVKETGPTGHKL